MRWFHTKSSWLALVALGAGTCIALATVIAGDYEHVGGRVHA